MNRLVIVATTLSLTGLGVPALAGWTTGAVQVPLAPPASYEGVLRQYASGEREAAVASLGRLQWKTLDQVFSRMRGTVDRAGRCEDCSDTMNAPIRAAAMLHLDRDLFENPPHQNVEQKPTCGGRHAERAMEYAGLLARRGRTRDFARHFFLAMTWRAEWDACLHQARTWARAGLNVFPEDPELRLALGVSYEKAARLRTDEPERSLRDARRELARAVAISPQRPQARVHLGRVLWHLGFMNEAQRTLDALVGAEADPGSRYLAHVFLGQVHERAGRAKLASEAFRRALQIVPDGQAAAIGLAHSLLLQGDMSGAAIAAERALSRGASSHDPYRDYNADNASGAPALFTRLRRESRQ